MNPKVALLLVNVVGGVAVLGSYVVGIQGHPGQTDLLWGTLPESARGLYGLNMIPAAIGYVTCFARLMLEDELPWRIVLADAVFLFFSTLWMPLVWHSIDHGLTAGNAIIQIVLAIAGAASVARIVLLKQLGPGLRPKLHLASLVGMGFLVLQCAVLDALVWPRFFDAPGG